MRILLATAAFACGGGVDDPVTGSGSVALVEPVKPPVKPPMPTGAPKLVQLALGTGGACARSDDGRVWCWGANTDGFVGTAGDDQPRPVQVPITGARELVVVGDSACARLADGTVQCWGSNRYGVLGTVMLTGRPAPAPVPGIAKATALFAVRLVVCASASGGAFTCWGQIAKSGLWGGKDDKPRGPTTIAGLRDVVEVSGTCVRHASGGVTCWDEELAPKRVPDLVAVELHEGCARRADGTAACWGNNAGCRLGLAYDPQAHDRPVAIKVGTVVQLFDFDKPCAVLADGNAWCQGLVDGEYPYGCPARPPRKLANLANVARVAGGCAILTGGGLVCGANSSLTESALQRKPPALLPLTGVVSAATTFGVGCALTADGAWCWGKNRRGRLGDGTTEDRAEPVRVAIDLAR